MLVSDFMVNSRLKNAQWYFYGIHGISYQGCIEEEKTMFAVHQGRAVLIATVANLLDTKYKLYGFSDGHH